MRALRRPVTAAILTLATLLGFGRPALAAPAVTWSVCPEDAHVECGTMRVPADWSNAYGPTIELQMARRKATDPAHRIGVLIVNPGGPGGSAVNMALDTDFFSPELRKRFDIIGLDPRGVGRSSPVLCSQALVDAKPSPLITDPAGFAALAGYNRRLAADCTSRSGPVVEHADTGSVVRDVEALRVALGEPRISIFGASYGSLIGELYSDRYPATLRAAVLDSVMDHSVDVDTFLAQETAAVQDSFNEFVKWCARDTRCVLRGQDIPKLWAALMQRAAAGTLKDPYDPPAKLGVWELISAAFAAFYDPQWFSFAHYLQDAAVPARAVARRARTVAPPADLTPDSFPAVFCGDWALPVGDFPAYRRRLDNLAKIAPQVRASPLALSAAAGCVGWPVAPAAPQHRLNPARIPMLLVNALHDPATGHAWAQQAAVQLGPSARLLTYQGWGHVAYSHSPCVQAAAEKYLLTLALPAVGATCPAVEPEPFGIG
ncbi:alpha/beta hydrolase [Actinoplanes sp. SE50]|uniref:alpha/beta hydrolase n=1 Tax=unclassified Actinoplanes TaxID=2626549 RepID=UPI00023EC195|nr:MULTISPECIES: alpha/beta hydrolase [unclassified Actinoplanes]AEV87524.1 Homoserine O-acetyltransferase [Actinoplanes sp. SE50/110]ATO85927.1 alpha/beta hydrolase [Actinoplanes sp. SE50]SLM03341.1 alpha/beta hydrolase [Actinoplanes sp. SE50/110]